VDLFAPSPVREERFQLGPLERARFDLWTVFERGENNLQCVATVDDLCKEEAGETMTSQEM
jgi:hypothetical protein